VRSARASYSCEFASPTDTHCVTEIVAGTTGGDSTAPVELVARDLAAAGLANPQVRYLVLVQGSASIICGMSEGPEDGDRDPMHVGHVAAVFLGDPNCPNDDPGSGGQVSWALAHEYLHNDGAVPYGAAHNCVGTSGPVCTGALGTALPLATPLTRSALT
jgi:hypothetical protein